MSTSPLQRRRTGERTGNDSGTMWASVLAALSVAAMVGVMLVPLMLGHELFKGTEIMQFEPIGG